MQAPPRALGRLSASTRRALAKRPTLHFRPYSAVLNERQKDPTELDQITALSNGVRVATESLPGPFAGIGVYLDAGSRYEDDDLRGVSHIVDRLAFKSTTSRTSDQMLESLESLGGNIQCASSRESLMYQAATFNAAVPTTLGLLAETIRDPLITDREIEQQLETADYEIREIWAKPELILPELVNVAAYKENTLGNPLLCPQERLQYIDRRVIEKYRQAFYKPERMVVAFAGIQHQEALKLAEQYFGDMRSSKSKSSSASTSFLDSLSSSPSSSASTSPSSSSSTYPSPPPSPSSSSSSQSSRLLNTIPFLKNLSTSATSQASVHASPPSTPYTLKHNLVAPSHYTGGFLSLPDLPIPTNPSLPHLSHIHLAFEALPISSPDIYALATLQTLLGGGGSFSAGGPGKGMYSRLYTNVLNQHGWVESCIAFNHSYTDSGLFGISASCTPSKVSQMLDAMCRELQNLTLEHGYTSLNEIEVSRAKNQLRSSLLMNLESRMVELEDLGRQVQVHGKKVGVKEMCRKIEELTVGDLRRVAREVLGGRVRNAGGGSGAPTVVLQEGVREQMAGRFTGGLRNVGGGGGAGAGPSIGWTEIQERVGRWKLGRR